MLTKYEIEEELNNLEENKLEQLELQNDAIRYYETPTPTRPVQIRPTVYDGPIFEYRPTQGGVRINTSPSRMVTNFTPRELSQMERTVGTNISSYYIEDIEENIPF